MMHILRAPFDSLRPQSLRWWDDKVKREADETNDFLRRNLSAHIVEWCTLQKPRADISPGCRADALRVQLEAVTGSKLGR